jgi:uncharacterized membrane protein YjdF
MKLTFQPWLLIIVNALYVLSFGIYYVSIKNFEFLWYVFVLVFFFALIGTTLHKTQLPAWLLWLLSLWGALHMAGGGIPVEGSVLYAYQLVHLFGSGESFVLKFDQVVHFYGFFVATLVVWHLLRPYVLNPYAFPVLFVTLCAGIGLGAINEVVEFAAVVAAPETGVGGYFNTAIDLVANMIGATAATFFIYIRR